MDAVLVGLDAASPTQKAIGGLIAGVPLHGEGARPAVASPRGGYPEALARAMVERCLRFFPLWYIGDDIVARDARLWTQQVIGGVGILSNLLGVLAGLQSALLSRHSSSSGCARVRRHAADRAR